MVRTALFASLLGSIIGCSTAVADSLGSFRWQKRIVLVFAGDNAQADKQLTLLLSDKAGLQEREIVLVAVTNDEARPLFGADRLGFVASEIRQRFDVRSSEFVVVLIGKDGGEKWRAGRAIERGELYGLIDAMPMRRSGK